jgi:hypothetical protein
MAEHTRDGKVVIDLTMGGRQSWTTTRDFFTKDDFTMLRDGMKKLEGTREGASALQHLKEGKVLTEPEKTLLKANIGKFGSDPASVKSVADWVKTNGAAVPESILNSGGHAIMQSDIRDAASRLAKQGDKAGPALETMRDIAAGKTVPDAARTSATKVFKEAGLLNGREELSIIGNFLAKNEGKAFTTAAGIKAAATVATTGADVAKAAHAVAESSSFLKGAGKAVAKKLPGIGTALGVIAAVSSVSSASAAELPAVTGQTPAEISQSEHARTFAEMRRNANVAKEVVVGAAGLLPVPGADIALRAHMDNFEQQLQGQYDRAQNGNRRETIDYDKLIFTPENKGGLSGDFNAVSPRSNIVMAEPENINLPKIRVVAPGQKK